MPRTCLACKSENRIAIDRALAKGEPFRNIAARCGISIAALHRHKTHVAQAIVKASEKREERMGDSLMGEMRRVQQKAWELLGKMEQEGDHRGSIVAVREIRECIGGLGEMLARVEPQGDFLPKLADRLDRAEQRINAQEPPEVSEETSQKPTVN